MGISILVENLGFGFPGCLVVKTLPSNAGGMGSIPGWGDKIHHALQPQTQNIKERQYGYKFNKYFKMFYIKKKNLKNKKNLGFKVKCIAVTTCSATHSSNNYLVSLYLNILIGKMGLIGGKAEWNKESESALSLTANISKRYSFYHYMVLISREFSLNLS